MSSRPSFSLGRALSTAFASLPAAWGGAWLVLILLWLVTAFGHQLIGTYYGDGLSVHLLKAIAFLLTLVILKLMSQGALYRINLFGKSAKSEGLGIGGLQFGLPELRLFGAGLIVGLFILMIVAAIFIVFAVAFNSAGLAEGYHSTLLAVHAMLLRHSGIDWIFIVFLIAAWLFLIFVSLKFCLMQAGTVAERRMVTLNTLGLSSGNVGKLFLGLLIFIVPFALIGGIGVHLLLPLMHGMGHGVSPLYVLHAILSGLAIFGLMPLVAGFLAAAYRQIVDLRAK